MPPPLILAYRPPRRFHQRHIAAIFVAFIIEVADADSHIFHAARPPVFAFSLMPHTLGAFDADTLIFARAIDITLRYFQAAHAAIYYAPCLPYAREEAALCRCCRHLLLARRH